MNTYFIAIQLVAVLAWLLLVISFYKKNTNKILVIQIVSSILYCIHYLFLGAYTAVFIFIVDVIRDYSYYKTELDKYIFYFLIPVYLIIGIFNFYIFIDILPIFSSLIDGFALTKSQKVIVIGGIVSYILWIIYDISVMSYTGALTDLLIVISNMSILLFGKNIIKANKKEGLKI